MFNAKTCFLSSLKINDVAGWNIISVSWWADINTRSSKCTQRSNGKYQTQIGDTKEERKREGERTQLNHEDAMKDVL